MESKRLQTAKKFIGLFATLDTQTLESILAPDSVQHLSPPSFNPPGPLSRKEQIAFVTNLGNILSGIPMTAKEYIESESSGTVTIWATSQAIVLNKVKDTEVPAEFWNFSGEYVFILTMDETGEKIKRTFEFLDSKNTFDKFIPLMERAHGNRANRLSQET